LSNHYLSFFRDQRVQDPITLDVDWLAVGHVDEVLQFIPSDSGFDVVVNSPMLGLCLLGSGRARPECQGASPRGVLFAADGTDRDSMRGTYLGRIANADSQSFVPIDPPRKKSDYHHVRIFEGRGAGQIASIRGVTRGRFRIERVWRTRSISSEGWTVERDCHLEKCPPRIRSRPRTTWFIRPDSTSRFVLLEDSKLWYSADLARAIPAAITSGELMDDRRFVKLNRRVADRIEVTMARLHRSITTEHGTIRVPTLFVGRTDPKGRIVDRSVVAMSPNQANLQSVGTLTYLAEPYGPAGDGSDPFKEWLDAHVPGAVFLDSWAAYHRLDGGVHCATYVTRQLPEKRWYEIE
jgi:hypothetical protein